MVKSAESKRIAARRRRASMRSHYHEHRVKRGGRWYNPLLDDPNHPDNTHHWSHGTIEGYNDAGCACARCGLVGREENERKVQARIDRRLTEHRSTAASVIATHLPYLSSSTAAELAEAVVDTNRVTDRFRARVVYDKLPVELALANWALAAGGEFSRDTAGEVAARLIEELAP